jgi:hypothetical protein
MNAEPDEEPLNVEGLNFTVAGAYTLRVFGSGLRVIDVNLLPSGFLVAGKEFQDGRKIFYGRGVGTCRFRAQTCEMCINREHGDL